MKSNRSRQLVIVAISAALGVCLGTAVRSAMRNDTQEKSEGAVSSEIGAASEMVSAVATKLTKEERQKGAELDVAPRPKRLLWFATRAEVADGEGMARLFEMAGDDDAIRKMLAARWAELDPQHMFDTFAEKLNSGGNYDYEIMNILMGKWAVSDLTSLVAALDNEGAYPRIGGTRMTAADIIMRIDPETGLGLLEKWNVRSYIPRMHKVVAWAKADPLGAAKKVAAIDADYAGREALGAVAKAWGEIDPAAALDFASSLQSEKRSTFAHKAMEAWAKRDLEAAIAYADTLEDVSFRGLVGSGLLAAWGRHDPAAALAWGEQNLRSQLRRGAVSQLVESLARKDPAAAAEVVAGLDNGGGRFAAVKELLKVWVRESDGKSIPEAVAWLGSLDDHDFAARALESSEWAFNDENPEAIIEIVGGPHAHLASDRVIRIAAEAQVRRSPEGALDWAGNLPADRAPAAGAAVIKEWVQLQPEAANTWAMELGPGEQRYHAINALARSYTNRPLDGLADWLGVLDNSERARAVDILRANYGSNDKKAELAAILEGDG